MGVIVRQKAKGRSQPWWVFITHNGKRTSRRIGSKPAAERAAQEIQARLALGDFDIEPAKKMPLFKDYAQGFMETYSTMNHKPSTRTSYRSALDLHLLPAFGGMEIDRISRTDIKGFINTKRGEGLSSSSVRNLKAYLSGILGEALDDELIPFNPASGTGKMIKKDDKPEIRPLTWEETKKFENSVQEHFPRYYPFFLTALRTGMRLGELVALKPGDLDFNGAFIEVRRAYTKGIIGRPKNGTSRKVDMSQQLQEILKRWKEPPEFLFYNEIGGMIDGDNLRRRTFTKALEKAGLRHIRIHDLRHTYASLRIGKGDNIQDVSKQLGHATVGFTLAVYSHWLPGQAKNQVDELDSQEAPICTLSAPCGGNGKEKGVAISANPLI